MRWVSLNFGGDNTKNLGRRKSEVQEFFLRLKFFVPGGLTIGGAHERRSMTTSKLPARPSLESLRKQAKKLARGVAAGDAGAIERARAQLPRAELPLSQRDAQLVLAREYGFRGWQDLVKEVKQRLGKGLEGAVSEARRRIHD